MAVGPRLPKIRGNDTMSGSYPRRVSPPPPPPPVSESGGYTFQSVINTPCKRLGDTGLVPPSRFRGFRFRCGDNGGGNNETNLSARSSAARLRASTGANFSFCPRRTPREHQATERKRIPSPRLGLRPKQYFYLWEFVGDDLRDSGGRVAA